MALIAAWHVFRAKLILMLSEGVAFATIRERLGSTNPTILGWKEQFVAEGTDGIDTNHPSPEAVSFSGRILGQTQRNA